ncbi:hypothetical protein ACVJMZ_000817 [Sinorhizobium medicae]
MKKNMRDLPPAFRFDFAGGACGDFNPILPEIIVI